MLFTHINHPGSPSWCPTQTTVRHSSIHPLSSWGLMALMVWTWTGSTLGLVEVLQRTRRGSLCSAKWAQGGISEEISQKFQKFSQLFINFILWIYRNLWLHLRHASEAAATATLQGKEPLMLDMRSLRLPSTVPPEHLLNPFSFTC